MKRCWLCLLSCHVITIRLIASAPSAPLLPLVAERVAQAAPVWTHQAHDTETTKDAEATQVLPGLLYTLHLTLNNTHRSAHHMLSNFPPL